jgi:nucleoside diphosphate kinase
VVDRGDSVPSKEDTEAFLLVTPDAVARHLTGEIVRRLSDKGLQVARFRIHLTAPNQIELFHARNPYVVADPQLHGMARELFALGPCVALGLVNDNGSPGDVFRRVNALKGLGEPTSALPGTLRHDLGSINTLLNLVHTASDPHEAVRDRLVFFEDGSGVYGGRSLPDAIGELEAWIPREARDLGDVLDQVRGVAPAVDGYVYSDFRSPDTADAGMAYVAEAGVVLDSWARLVLRTSMRFPCASNRESRRPVNAPG